MSAAAATGNNKTGLDLTASLKGDVGNLISVVILKDPAGATGVSTLVESGNSVTVKLANDGSLVTETISGIKAALNTGLLTSAVLHTAATGANTGAEVASFALVGGADGTYGYDDLAAATGDGWTLSNVAHDSGQSVPNVDVLTKVVNGRRVRVAAAAITGATNVVQSAYNYELFRARRGLPRTLKAIGATGAGEYVI